LSKRRFVTVFIFIYGKMRFYAFYPAIGIS